MVLVSLDREKPVQVHRTDYLNGGTALHFAALLGHARCLRLVLADYVLSILNFCSMMNHKSSEEDSAADSVLVYFSAQIMQ